MQEPGYEIVARFNLNGTPISRRIPSNMSLCDFLHDEVGLSGTKKGCDTGECGACTVLLDGKPIVSCLVLAPQVNGHDVTTIEGLGNEKELHPIQEAFLESDAVQCGYCIPGMIVTMSTMSREIPDACEEEVWRYMSGNLCRCTGYQQQVDAAELAAKKKGAPNEDASDYPTQQAK